MNSSYKYMIKNSVNIKNLTQIIGLECYKCKQIIKDINHSCFYPNKYNRKIYILKCRHCNKKFVYNYTFKNGSTCSFKCFQEFQSNKIHNAFKKNPRKSFKVDKICCWCGKNFKIHRYRFKNGGLNFCCRNCHYSWRIQYNKSHPEKILERAAKQSITIKKKILEGKFHPFKKAYMKKNRIETFVDFFAYCGAKYVGNHQHSIIFKNGKLKYPDFILEPINKTKKIIEVAGNYWHTKEEMDEVIKNYSEIGYDCLVIWEDEIYSSPNIVANKIREFTHTMIIGIYKLDKKLPNPNFAYNWDSGFDLYSTVNITIDSYSNTIIPCGVVLILPNYIECQIRGRSGLAKKGILCHFGTVDSQFRGELGPILFNTTDKPYYIKRGDRVCQAVVSPKFGMPIDIDKLKIIEVDSFDETDRGNKGFGSSGK